MGRSGAAICKAIKGWNPETTIDQMAWDDNMQCFQRWLSFDDEEGLEPPINLSSDAPVQNHWLSAGISDDMSN